MSKKSKAAHAFITEEFKAYAAAWIDLVVRDEIQEACFPSGLEKIHRTVRGFDSKQAVMHPWETATALLWQAFQNPDPTCVFFNPAKARRVSFLGFRCGSNGRGR